MHEMYDFRSLLYRPYAIQAAQVGFLPKNLLLQDAGQEGFNLRGATAADELVGVGC